MPIRPTAGVVIGLLIAGDSSNIGVSVGEDVAVAGVTSLAVLAPTAAAVVAGV